MAPDELRAPGEIGVEPLEAAVVERQHVVLRRLEQEEPLGLRELPGCSDSRSCACVQSSGA